MSARPGPSGGYHASGIPTGISNFDFFRFGSYESSRKMSEIAMFQQLTMRNELSSKTVSDAVEVRAVSGKNKAKKIQSLRFRAWGFVFTEEHRQLLASLL